MTISDNNIQKKHIPHIFHVIPSFAHGGVPIRISYLMNHFGSRARHSLFSTDGNYQCTGRLSDNVNCEIINIGNADQGNMVKRLWHYHRILQDIKPDLLLTYNWGSTEWALAASFTRLYRHIHLESGFGPEESHGTMAKRDWFRRLALRNIEAIVVPSQTLVKICRSGWKIPERKIRYIPNGVDCEKYASAPQKDIIPGFTKDKNDLVIGTMTPLRPEKNLARLITAFRDIVRHFRAERPEQKCKLIIMGEGRERPKLEAMIAEYGLKDNIYLAGHIDDPARALGLLDIYAISSDTEQMPNSLNQAMAAGLPVVGLDVGDVKFMMAEQNKPFITPAGDDHAFTMAMMELSKDKALREALTEINKKHVKENFDQQFMYDKYAGIWGIEG